MGYLLNCARCEATTWAANIVDLIDQHTGSRGVLRCVDCGRDGATIERTSDVQEPGETWRRWIRRVIRIKTAYRTYSPYVFVLHDAAGNAKPYGIHLQYYKDTRHLKHGRLKHGHGPGGGPVLTPAELLQLLVDLAAAGVLTARDLERTAQKIRAA
jgi:hypothetical protein